LDDEGNLEDAKITTEAWKNDTKAVKLEKSETNIAGRKPVSSKRWVFKETDGSGKRYEETTFTGVERDDEVNLEDAKITTEAWKNDTKAVKLEKSETNIAARKPVSSKRWVLNATDGSVKRYKTLLSLVLSLMTRGISK